ncbi:hypothetical protein FHR84_000524 [Actinopolyspora biskrensis]|uniref:Uncharacterized protein n=1 Tax=Actinopolyspora biskrensis TaxID=1470178 RepID=A0A852YSX6_9ACTN|nr:transcriptional regulator [Actinopolyspora biskrensis]NYH77210.1 hypothetical protein [Actinopolyspora biskrensis]
MRTFRTVLEQRIRERRQTLEEFAEYAETFAREHGEPGTLGLRHLQRLASGRGTGGKPLGPVRPATARLLERIFDESIDDLLAEPSNPVPSSEVTSGRSQLNAGQLPSTTGTALREHSTNAGLETACDWLDQRAQWSSRTAEQQVRSQLAQSPPTDLHDWHAQRAKVGRSQLVDALSEYYGPVETRRNTYHVRCDDRGIATSILTRPDWLDLACPLTPDNDRLTFTTTSDHAAPGEFDATRAVDRLTEAAALDVQVSNEPLYRLLDIDIKPGSIDGTVSLVPFVEYALTADLLESELIKTIGSDSGAQRHNLPLRDRYLPDLASVLDLPGRLCAGGTLALCAIARPASPYRGEADYALLVQQRSNQVINAAESLAVIPKGFHQPLKEFRADASIGVTLRRELEEELFGRSEVDSTAGPQRIAAPMHPSRLSEPMRWITEHPECVRTECTGFGFNLVSGNFEFPALILVEDEEFWKQYGGQLEANWETAGLRLYSSADRDLVNELLSDESWSNEGLFAMLQGIRRLGELGDERVDLPAVDPAMQA